MIAQYCIVLLIINQTMSSFSPFASPSSNNFHHSTSVDVVIIVYGILLTTITFRAVSKLHTKPNVFRLLHFFVVAES